MSSSVRKEAAKKNVKALIKCRMLNNKKMEMSHRKNGQTENKTRKHVKG